MPENDDPIAQTIRNLLSRPGAPSAREVAEMAGTTRQKLCDMLAGRRPISSEVGAAILAAIQADPAEVARLLTDPAARAAPPEPRYLPRRPEVVGNIPEWGMGADWSQTNAEIGRLVGVSREAVRKIRDRAQAAGWLK